MSRKTDSAKRQRDAKGARGIQTIALLSVGALALTAYAQLDKQILRTEKPLNAFGGGKKGALAGPSARGPILTSDGRMAAESQESYKMYLHQKMLPASPTFFADLSQGTGLPSAELTALRAKKTKEGDPVTVTFDQGLTFSQVERARAVQERWQTAGLSFEERPARIAPLGEAVADLVGASSFEEDLKEKRTKSIGLSGLESSANGLLTGEGPVLSSDKIRVVGLSDDLKKKLQQAAAENPERRGIVLTVDSNLQQAAYEAVRRAVIKTSAAGGSALVLEPKSGDLVAAADYPPGRTITHTTSKGPVGYLFAPTDAAFEPGSTWKLLTLALAYHLRLLSPGDQLVSTATLGMPAGRPIRNHGGHSFGTVTPGQAMAHSCNTTFARLALLIGEQRYYTWLRSTQAVERKAGLGIRAETRGLFPYGPNVRDVASLGFGQGINMTPASLIGLFGMIANEGRFVSPRLIKTMGGVDLPIEDRGQLLSPEACRETLKAAEMVVTEKYGTGHKLGIPGISLGGKTGTAQIVRQEQAVGYRANFVGFVPARNPKYVILVMVDRPSHADFYGASVAGPAVVDIVKALAEQGKIPAPVMVKAEPLPSAKPVPQAAPLAAAAKQRTAARRNASSTQISTSRRTGSGDGAAQTQAVASVSSRRSSAVSATRRTAQASGSRRTESPAQGRTSTTSSTRRRTRPDSDLPRTSGSSVNKSLRTSSSNRGRSSATSSTRRRADPSSTSRRPSSSAPDKKTSQRRRSSEG